MADPRRSSSSPLVGSLREVAGGELRLLLRSPADAGRDPVRALEGLLAEAAERLAAADLPRERVVRRSLFFDPAALPAAPSLLASPAASDDRAGPGVRDPWADAPPPTAWIAQPPLCGGPVALELTAFRAREPSSPPPCRPSASCTVVELGPLTRCCVAVARPLSAAPDGTDLYQEGLALLERADEELRQQGLGFADVVRAWFYIPEILACPGGRQHYQQFNDARAAFYDRVGQSTFLARLLPGDWPGLSDPARGRWPASTGIGAASGRLQIEIDALAVRSAAARVLPIENPRQVSAYAYPEGVLRSAGRARRAPPRFSRGIVEVGEEVVRVQVSGTASIRGAETLHVGDPVAQTEATLDTIARLIDATNLAAQGVPVGLKLADLATLRVYLKRPADLPAVQEVVQRRCPGVPGLFLRADVCREELLVEIEGFGALPLSRSPAAVGAVPDLL